MRGPRKRAAGVFALMLVVGMPIIAGAPGCAAPEHSPTAHGGPIRPSLALPAPPSAVVWGGAETGWETTRNDDALGIGRASGVTEAEVFEVRTRDQRSTTNGRVQETSRTLTRIIRGGRLR